MTTSQTVASPAQLMTLFSDRAAAGDLDGLVALYEPEAVLVPRPGVVLRGTDEIRQGLAELVAAHPKIRYEGDQDVVLVGDIALVANAWSMTVPRPDGTVYRDGGLSADVLRRQPDGHWLVLIDQPRGEPEE